VRSFGVVLASLALFAAPLSGCTGDSTKDATTGHEADRGAQPQAARRRHLPNVVLETHEGKTVRFYDDLIKGKIVAINFMYATCKER